MAKRWKKEETTYLKRYSAKKRVLELAERFGTDADTVRAKLDEEDLEAIDHQKLSIEPDPGVDPLEKGVKALYAKKYPQAEKHFSHAEEITAQQDVANSARRYLAVVRERMASEAKASGDPYLEALYERNRGNFEAALEICSRGGRQSKDERFAHLAAAIYSITGELDKAVKFLDLAIQLNPKNRVLAYHDSDFEALRESPEHADIFVEAE